MGNVGLSHYLQGKIHHPYPVLGNGISGCHQQYDKHITSKIAADSPLAHHIIILLFQLFHKWCEHHSSKQTWNANWTTKILLKSEDGWLVFTSFILRGVKLWVKWDFISCLALVHFGEGMHKLRIYIYIYTCGKIKNTLYAWMKS